MCTLSDDESEFTGCDSDGMAVTAIYDTKNIEKKVAVQLVPTTSSDSKVNRLISTESINTMDPEPTLPSTPQNHSTWRSSSM